MRPDLSVPEEVLTDVGINIYTAVQENAMPGAVTPTVQRVEYRETDEQPPQRVITWLGRSAIQVAESGYDFHFSQPAHLRVGVEVAEARHTQETITAGRAQAFISPKMTRHDAAEELAKAEHLHDDDSIRVSRAVTDSQGTVIARYMESLLVSDVPFEAWVAMLKDPGNIFDRAFDIRDERSALSVMELFSEFEVPEEQLPEGPVNIVGAVIPYIADTSLRKSVLNQLNTFRGDQLQYRVQAERTAQELLAFDLELARSLYTETATKPVEAFIGSLQHQWGRDDLDVINGHFADGAYVMTRELAVVLEKAQQNLLNSEAAILTGNEKVLQQMSPEVAEQIQTDLKFAEMVRAENPHSQELQFIQMNNRRNIARQNLEVGGGCGNKNAGQFENDYDPSGSGDGASEADSESRENWSWQKGVCRVDACTSPKPTEVGPCSVCRNCQHMFDLGLDPTGPSSPKPKLEDIFKKPEWLVKLLTKPSTRPEVAEHEVRAGNKADLGRLVLA